MLISIVSSRFSRLLRQQLLVGGEAGLRLRLARARRGAHPFELARQRALPRRLGLLFALEPLPLLLEPRRIVALPGDPGAAIQLEDPARHVVEEVAIVRHRDDRPRVLVQVVLEPGDALGVEVVGRLVEQQHVGALEQDPAERHAAPLAARQLGDVGVGGREPERVHRDLQRAIEIPAVGRLDRVLQLALLVEQLVHLAGLQVLAQLQVHLVEPGEQPLGRPPPPPRRFRARSSADPAPAPGAGSRCGCRRPAWRRRRSPCRRPP